MEITIKSIRESLERWFSENISAPKKTGKITNNKQNILISVSVKLVILFFSEENNKETKEAK